MIYDLNDLRGFKIITLNDKIGTAHDFYFNSENWKIYYLMCDAGYQMTDRIVIFYTEAIVRIEFDNNSIFLNLDKNRILDSPYISSEKVVTKQECKTLHDYYGWNKYWEKENYLEELKKKDDKSTPELERINKDFEAVDGLNCSREIINQTILADNKEIGLLKNMLMDASSWKISYLLIDPYNTENEKKLVIKPTWIHSFKRDKQKIELDKSLSKVFSAPKVDGVEDITEEIDVQLSRI